MGKPIFHENKHPFCKYLKNYYKARSVGLVSAVIADAGRTQIAPGAVGWLVDCMIGCLVGWLFS